MKRFYAPLLFLAALILVSASISEPGKKSFFAAAIVGDSLLPVLPNTPFHYDISFPEHALFGGWSFIDSSLINGSISDKGATLGRVLFYDKRLSGSGTVACASCHKQEHSFADNVQFSEGVNETPTVRNSPNLNDIAWGGNGFDPFFGGTGLFWDSRETFLEDMVLMPISHEGELGKDLDFLPEKLAGVEYYAALFADAFGDATITKDRIGSALAQFIRSMASFESHFDKVMMGHANYNAAEAAGQELFQMNCGSCHAMSHFGVPFPQNTGLDMVCYDLGVASWSGNTFDIGTFRSPSLRNIALTAPYMHDGRFETLEEVIDFYSEEIEDHPNSAFQWMGGDSTFQGFNFTEQQKGQLKAFMETLTDPAFVLNERWADPFELVNTDRFLPLEEEVTLFPNPVGESLTVQLSNTNGEAYILQLSNADGKVVKSVKTHDATVVMERSQLPDGVYFLEIKKGNRKKVEQVLMQ